MNTYIITTKWKETKKTETTNEQMNEEKGFQKNQSLRL